MSSQARNLSADNIFRKVFDEASESLKISGSISTTAPVGGSTEAKQDVANASLSSIDSKLTSPIAVSGSFSLANPEVYTTTSLIDASSTNISNSTFLQLVASTTQITKKIQSIEDIGEFMAIYVGSSGAETMLCALPLGGGEVEVNVPAGSRLTIRSLNNTVTSGRLILNLLK
jgi:hypothetical protein